MSFPFSKNIRWIQKRNLLERTDIIFENFFFQIILFRLWITVFCFVFFRKLEFRNRIHFALVPGGRRKSRLAVMAIRVDECKSNCLNNVRSWRCPIYRFLVFVLWWPDCKNLRNIFFVLHLFCICWNQSLPVLQTVNPRILLNYTFNMHRQPNLSLFNMFQRLALLLIHDHYYKWMQKQNINQ